MENQNDGNLGPQDIPNRQKGGEPWIAFMRFWNLRGTAIRKNLGLSLTARGKLRTEIWGVWQKCDEGSEVREDAIKVIQQLKRRIHFIGWPAEAKFENGTPDWAKEIAMIENFLSTYGKQ